MAERLKKQTFLYCGEGDVTCGLFDRLCCSHQQHKSVPVLPLHREQNCRQAGAEGERAEENPARH